MQKRRALLNVLMLALCACARRGAIADSQVAFSPPAPQVGNTVQACEVGDPDPGAVPIEIGELLKKGDEYNGKIVHVRGFVVLQHEGSAIYVSLRDFNQGRRWNAVWLRLARSLKGQNVSARCTEKYGVVEGRFDANEHGHGDLYGAAITDVARVSAQKSME